MDSCVVSVIVTCYNQESYLAETLDSVLSQSFADWECVIINDGSTDKSEAIAKKYVEKDNRFKYLYQQNQGVVAARNNAIASSHGKYILPLDGDDIIANQYLELAVPIMEADEQMRVVYCEVELFGGMNGILELPPLTLRNVLHRGCCVSASLFRRKDFDDVGGYKQIMNKGWEDWEFFISLMEKEGKTYKIDRTLFYYRVLAKSRNTGLNPKSAPNMIGDIVSAHANTYYDEYSKLIIDYENRSFMREMASLCNERRFYVRMAKVSVIIMRVMKKLLSIMHL